MSDGQPSNPDLSATGVIAIGAVCAAVLIALLCVLVYFICRRRQNNAAKDYENQNANRQTQPVNGVNIPAKPKRGFDNPDSGQNHMNYPSHANPHNGQPPNGQPPNGNIPLDTSYDSQLEKRLYENEMNRRNDNMNSEAFNKHTDSSFPGTQRKDQQQYIDLHPEDHKEGGSFGSGMESGYSTPDSSKPKKKQGNRRLTDTSYYSEHSQFAHDPPGHTCGLPCCNSDLYVHFKVQGHHAGCMAIPFLHRKIIEDNFTFRKHQRSLLTGKPTFTNRFHSLQPPKLSNRKPLPKFGTTRNLFDPGSSSTDPGNTLDHEQWKNQGHFLTGREITLPRNINQVYDEYRLKNFDMGESADVDSSDSESNSDSSSDTEYYAKIPSIKGDYSADIPQLPGNLIYPWDRLTSSKDIGSNLKSDQDENPMHEEVNKKRNNDEISINGLPPDNANCEKSNGGQTQRNLNDLKDGNTYEEILDKNINAQSHSLEYTLDTKQNGIGDTSQNIKSKSDSLRSTTEGDIKSKDDEHSNSIHDETSEPVSDKLKNSKREEKTCNTKQGVHVPELMEEKGVSDTERSDTLQDHKLDNSDKTEPIYYDIMSDIKFERYVKMPGIDKRYRDGNKSQSLPVSIRTGGYETLQFQNNMFKNQLFRTDWRQKTRLTPSEARRHTLDRTTNLGKPIVVKVNIHDQQLLVCNVSNDSKPKAKFYIGENIPASARDHEETGYKEAAKGPKPPPPRRDRKTRMLNPTTCNSDKTNLDFEYGLDSSKGKDDKRNGQLPVECTSSSEGDKETRMGEAVDKHALGSLVKEGDTLRKESSQSEDTHDQGRAIQLQNVDSVKDAKTIDSVINRYSDTDDRPQGCMVPSGDNVVATPSDTAPKLNSIKGEHRELEKRLSVINEAFENDEEAMVSDIDEHKTNEKVATTANPENSTNSKSLVKNKYQIRKDSVYSQDEFDIENDSVFEAPSQCDEIPITLIL